jgi:tRNA(fMet)-specific endonuclease VapC
MDATAFSAAMRREPGIMDFLKSRSPDEVATVPPVIAEIEFGIQRIEAPSRKRMLLEREKDRLLGVVKVLPWNVESSREFGSIKAGLERAGAMIDDFDIAIAAIAMSHDARVLTANLSHFSRIPGLSCARW